MELNSISSKYLQDAVNQFSKLPGIGKKSALRIVMHLLKIDSEKITELGESILKLHENIQYCERCHNISDSEYCNICVSKTRDQHIICVVENIRDVISIESTGQYNGAYHVLSGLISPLNGIGPDQLNIESLKKRCEESDIEEIIMALSPNIEGDTTVYYLSKFLKENEKIKITSIARGISFGGDLEYTDEFTLGKALIKRLPIDNVISN